MRGRKSALAPDQGRGCPHAQLRAEAAAAFCPDCVEFGNLDEIFVICRTGFGHLAAPRDLAGLLI
jgi:hypothetical protein